VGTAPKNYERDLKKVTLRACAALLQKTTNPETRLVLQNRWPDEWQELLSVGRYGRHDHEYIREAIEELDSKIGEPACPTCSRVFKDDRHRGYWYCESCMKTWAEVR
jgi:hypothetical protein